MRIARSLPALLVSMLFASLAGAHPGSSIAVDRQGTIFFADTLRGIWKIDPAGTLTFVGAPNFHFFALDEENGFAKFSRHTVQDEMRPVRVAAGPTLLTSSDFPVAVQRGALYFAPGASGKALPLVRAAPDGSTATVATLPGFGWLNGIAAAKDGSIVGSVDAGIFRLSTSGAISWIARQVTVPDCRRMSGNEDEPPPYLRGLAVDVDGSVVVAATGCRAVVRITPAGKVSTILSAEPPWSPTGVALAGGNVYVLEYDHSAVERVWPPRVRKVEAGGKVTELGRVKR